MTIEKVLSFKIWEDPQYIDLLDPSELIACEVISYDIDELCERITPLLGKTTKGERSTFINYIELDNESYCRLAENSLIREGNIRVRLEMLAQTHDDYGVGGLYMINMPISFDIWNISLTRRHRDNIFLEKIGVRILHGTTIGFKKAGMA